MSTQAERVIAAFGGAGKLAKMCGFERNRAYRWTYDKENGGTGGLIPADAMPTVIDAARENGILLTAEMLDPRPKHNAADLDADDEG